MTYPRPQPLSSSPAPASETAPSTLRPTDPDLLPKAQRRRLLLSYGLGDAGTGMAASLIGFYLFIFYTSAAGLPAWMAGLVLMVARLWDAFNDPVVGWLSDHTRTRWGPRLPWILYTCVNLPYSALPAELTESTTLRTQLNTSRFTGSIIASLIGIVLGGLLLKDHHIAGNYLRLGLLSGSVIAVCTLLCAWGIAPAARLASQPQVESGSTRRQLRRVRSNSRFLMVLGLYLMLWCALQIMQTAALIYLPVVMRLPESWSNWILLPFQIMTLVGLQIWTRVAAVRGRVQALRWGTTLWIAGCLAAMLMLPLDAAVAPTGSVGNLVRLVLLLAAILLVGLGASTAYLIPWSLLPDAIDADPEKPAGQFSAWMVLGQKVCISVALFLFGNLMSLSGYQASRGILQPDSALVAIRLCMGLIPAVLVVLGLVIMRRWPERGLHLQAHHQ